MNTQEKWLTIGFLSILVLFNIWMITLGKHSWIVSSINILFHEAGHFLFSFFGRFIMVLGGTLGELLMPAIFLGYFTIHRQIPGQVFAWWWLSVAFYDVAIYMADARVRVLPLLGGQDGHDWAYLFGRLGLLNQDILISRFMIIISLCITVYMIILVHKYWELSREKVTV